MENKVQITLEAVNRTKEAFGQIESQTRSTLSSLKQNWLALAGGVAAGYFAIKGGIDIITDLINVAAEAEEAERRAAFQIETWGYKFREIKPYIDDFADSILKTTRFSDEMARQGLGQMMQYSGDIEQAMSGVRLAMDMATQMGEKDFLPIIRYVGMAMHGNVEILGRWIPELRNLEQTVGANATAAEKWAATQDLLNKKFGGAAQADLKTYAGQVAQLKNEYDEMKETIGRGLKPYAEDWVAGVKSIMASGKLFDENSFIGKLLNLTPLASGINSVLGQISKNVRESEASDKAVTEAKRKAAEQALDVRAKKQYALELSFKNEIVKLDVDYQKKFFQLTDDRIGLIRLERDEALKAAQEKYKGIFIAETAIQKIRDYYNESEIRLVQEKNKQIREYNEAMKSSALSTMQGLGVKTAAGAQTEIINLVTQFQKLRDSGLFSSEELEKAKAAVIEKINEIKAAYSNFFGEVEEELRDEEGNLKVRWTKLIPKDEMTKTIETMADNAIASLERLKDAVAGPFRPLVQDDSITDAIQKIQYFEDRLRDIVSRAWYVQLNITGIGSSERPIMEKIDEIYGGFEGMSDFISQMKFTMELSSINSQLEKYRGRLSSHLSAPSWEQYGWAPGAYERYGRGMYEPVIAGLEGQRNYLLQAQAYYQSGAGAYPSERSMQLGVAINVGTMNLFGGSASEIAQEFDKAIAELIEKDRSKIKLALKQ